MSKLIMLAALAALATTMVAAGPASATLTTVTCAPFGADDLQAKISAAAPGDILLIRGTCTGNFNLTQSVTLQGASPGATLSGGGAGRPLLIFGAGTVTIRNLTVTGGSMIGGGGGGIVADFVTLNLVNSTVRGNTVSYFGGGINAYGATLNVIGSTVSGNTTLLQDGDGNGAGIWVGDSVATVTDSTVSGNTSGSGGGGLDAELGTTLTLTDSRVTGNTAFGAGGGSGGGISNGGGTVSLINSSVDHNTSGGGGGIWNDSVSQDATLTIDHSTIAFNRALGSVAPPGQPSFGGAGIMNFSESGFTSSVVATHVTMTGNQSPAGYGAIDNLNAGGAAALVTLSQSFLAGNQAALGAGIYNDTFDPSGPASISLQAGTIITLNHASIDGGGVYNSATGNLQIAPGATVVLNSPNNISDKRPRRDS